MTDSQQWLEPSLLPGYRVSRAAIQLTEDGRKHGCPEPQLGKSESGDLAYWIRPMGHPAAIRIRIEGLRGFFDAKPKDR
ncbi:MAG: hypothetical protein ACPGSE_00055 [Synechococcus sp.]